MFKLFIMSILSNLTMLGLLNSNIGEANGGGEGGEGGGDKGGQGASGGEGKVTFSSEQQEYINSLVASERKKTEQRYADYNDLKKKVEEVNQSQSQQEQQQLEAAKKYEEAKKRLEDEKNQLAKTIAEKDQNIKNMMIDNRLTNAVNAAGGHADAIAVMKSSGLVSVDDNGEVTIKGKDANGLDAAFSVEEGVKQFLKDRPHLVKASGQGGSGTPPAGGGSGGEGSGRPSAQDRMQLQQDIQAAQMAGDHKRVADLKKKLQENIQKSGAIPV